MTVETTAKQKDILRNLSADVQTAQARLSLAVSAMVAGHADVPEGAQVEIMPDGNLSVPDKEE